MTMASVNLCWESNFYLVLPSSVFENCLEFGVEFQVLEIILKWGLFEASSILILHIFVIDWVTF